MDLIHKKCFIELSVTASNKREHDGEIPLLIAMVRDPRGVRSHTRRDKSIAWRHKTKNKKKLSAWYAADPPDVSKINRRNLRLYRRVSLAFRRELGPRKRAFLEDSGSWMGIGKAGGVSSWPRNAILKRTLSVPRRRRFTLAAHCRCREFLLPAVTELLQLRTLFKLLGIFFE